MFWIIKCRSPCLSTLYLFIYVYSSINYLSLSIFVHTHTYIQSFFQLTSKSQFTERHEDPRTGNPCPTLYQLHRRTQQQLLHPGEHLLCHRLPPMATAENSLHCEQDKAESSSHSAHLLPTLSYTSTSLLKDT